MYHPTSRVLAVLELLQSHRRMTGVEMARRLEVNVRTLRRYITMLQDLGIPIVAERGRDGAYTLGAGYRMPPMLFTNDEALALEVGLLAADQLGLTEQIDAIESARAKLEYVMPPELKIRAHTLSETIQLDTYDFAAPPSTSSMLVMSTAVQQKRRVRLHYESSDSDVTVRDIDPYGIASRQGKWYVVGWCHLRRAIRSFRMDRIVEAYPSDVGFSPPDNFDALAYIEHAIATLPRDFYFEVLLKTDIVTADTHIHSVYGVLESASEGVLMCGSTDDLPCLARVLAGLPFGFAIQEPTELRDAVRDLAAQLARFADS